MAELALRLAKCVVATVEAAMQALQRLPFDDRNRARAKDLIETAVCFIDA